MKAGVLFAKNDIRCADWETPEMREGEILVKVRAAGICGSDILRVLGDGAHFFPIVLGHEFSGEVVETGAGVSGFEAGQRVSGAPLIPCMKCRDCQKGNYSLCENYTFIGSRIQGSFAEYVKLPAQNAVKFDKSIPFEQGAFFEPSTVALHGLRLAEYTGGGDVAVLGGGTIGLFTMQWAKIFGAKSVTVYDISDERLKLAKKLGADYTVNTLNEKIKKASADWLFETAGQVKTMQAAFETASNKASVCFIGTPHENLTFTPAQWENMNRKEIKLTGSWMSYSAPFPGEEWALTAHYFKTGQLKFDGSLIFRRFRLSEIDKAFDLYRENKVGGKILLEPD
jgi:L-iditol 2-dehydrogenase